MPSPSGRPLLVTQELSRPAGTPGSAGEGPSSRELGHLAPLQSPAWKMRAPHPSSRSEALATAAPRSLPSGRPLPGPAAGTASTTTPVTLLCHLPRRTRTSPRRDLREHVAPRPWQPGEGRWRCGQRERGIREAVQVKSEKLAPRLPAARLLPPRRAHHGGEPGSLIVGNAACHSVTRNSH